MPNATLNPLLNPTITDEEKQRTIADIQTKITEAQAQLATARTALERETVIRDTVQSMAGLGEAYPTEYIKAMGVLTAAISPEEKKAIYDKYGISTLETKAFAAPTATFETTYKRLYEESGLGDIKTKMDAKQDEINKVQADYDAETQKVNEDPWLSEGRRLGKNRVITDMYDKRMSRLNAEYTTFSNQYDRGKSEAENIATRALMAEEKGQTRTKEELNYYIKRAETDIEASKTLKEAEETKELYRYLPEYTKKYTKKETPQLKQLSNGEWAWIYPNGKVVKTGEKGKETAPISRATLNKLNTSGIKDDLALDIQAMFSQGYSDDQIKQALTDAKLDPKLLNTFKDIIGKAGESIVIIPPTK